jgi:uncharacterized membrane protein
MSILQIIKDVIRRQFLSGVLVVVPLILTYVVLRFLFESIDGILSPIVQRLFGYHVWGLGIIFTLLLILLTGFFTRNLVGAKLYRCGDKVLTRTPIIRIFYLAAKQLIEAITRPHISSFKEVVMIEYPRKGTYALGFATARVRLDKSTDKKYIGVFIPSTPTPVSGIVIFVPEEEVKSTELTIEEGIKMIVSGGIVAPKSIMAEDSQEVL